jgi:hypothetical protein
MAVSPEAPTPSATQPNDASRSPRRATRIPAAGAVRTVDRLVDAGLVERRASPADRRTVELRLTRHGQRLRRHAIDARNHALGCSLAPLDADDRRTLGALVDRMLTGLAAQPDGGYSICRLCDPDDCAAVCPVEAGITGLSGVRSGR